MIGRRADPAVLALECETYENATYHQHRRAATNTPLSRSADISTASKQRELCEIIVDLREGSPVIGFPSWKGLGAKSLELLRK
jgi:hypothetical protein